VSLNIGSVVPGVGGFILSILVGSWGDGAGRSVTVSVDFLSSGD